MKTQMVVLTALIVMLSFALTGQVWAQTVETVQQDLAKAEWYQELANLGRLVIENYRDEREIYGTATRRIDATRNAAPTADEIDRDYDSLIGEGERHITELEKLAERYRLQAKELVME